MDNFFYIASALAGMNGRREVKAMKDKEYLTQKKKLNVHTYKSSNELVTPKFRFDNNG